MVQMNAYGDRVQLSLSGPGQRPPYQVINAADKKMAFDGNHHLLQPAEDTFAAGNVSSVYSLEQITVIAAGGGVRVAAGRVARAGNGAPRTPRNTTAVKASNDLIDAEKYRYFKDNRDMLPPTIGKHSAQITELMKKGMAAEQAFDEVIKLHYE
ncbi:MAG: hypothetical protein JWP38_2294 [Herbaspirillum sp.]|nr:hypothetical protein [Herbaspirillum sp.]